MVPSLLLLLPSTNSRAQGMILVSAQGLWAEVGQEEITTCEERLGKCVALEWRTLTKEAPRHLSFNMCYTWDFTAYENDSWLFFFYFSLSKLLTFSPHTASTAGCLKGRGHKHVVNRIRAQTFTEHGKAAMKCKIYDSLDCCSQIKWALDTL